MYYQVDPGSISISYKRAIPKGISPDTEDAIEFELMRLLLKGRIQINDVYSFEINKLVAGQVVAL